MADGLNFKDFVAFLSAFSAKASMQHKIQCKCLLLYNLTGLFTLLIKFHKKVFDELYRLQQVHDNDLYWEHCLHLFKCITYVAPFWFATCS